MEYDLLNDGPTLARVDYQQCLHPRIWRVGFTPDGRQVRKCVICGKAWTENAFFTRGRERILQELAPFYLRGISIDKTANLSGRCRDTVWRYFRILRQFEQRIKLPDVVESRQCRT